MHSGEQAEGGGQAARTGDNAQRHDHHQPKQGERPDQRRRTGNHPAEDCEERCVAGGLEVLEVRVTERLGQCERVRTLVLQAGRVEVVDGAVRMVVGAAADRPELQPREPMLAQHRAVGVERPEPDLRDRRLTDCKALIGANSWISPALPEDVLYSAAGPALPGPSRLSRTPPSRAYGCCLAKASAPMSPGSYHR